MSIRTIGVPILTADMAGVPVKSQRFRHPTNSFTMAGCVWGLIKYNSPTFSNVYLNLYADRGGSVGKLIATSTTSYTSAEIATMAHALKTAGFAFDKRYLQGSVWYHMVLMIAGYTGNSSSHIAYRHSYPDPQYVTGITTDAAHGDNHPFEMSIIGELVK